MTERINLLTNELNKHQNELLIIKREHTTQMIASQSRIQLKDEEVSWCSLFYVSVCCNKKLNYLEFVMQIRMSQENEINYKKQITQLTDRIDELNARLTGQSEIEKQLQQKYINEIDSRTKLADMYKGSFIVTMLS